MRAWQDEVRIITDIPRRVRGGTGTLMDSPIGRRLDELWNALLRQVLAHAQLSL